MKKVLIIAYFFPPLGGGGVQRTVKFIKYLSRKNWDVHVLTTMSQDETMRDPDLLKDIPENVQITRSKFLSINSLLSFLTKIGFGFANSFLIKFIFPDLQIGWFFPARYMAIKIIDEFKPDIVYTTSSPITSHFIGLSIKKKFPDLKWVADFRDPWSLNAIKYNFLGERRRKFDKKYEKVILGAANHIIVSTESNKREILNEFKVSKGKITAITNGYDDEDFKNILPKNNTESFTITYIGEAYSTYNPAVFIETMMILLEDKNLKIKFQFIGNSVNWVKNFLKKTNCSKEFCSYFEFVDYVPHDQIPFYLSKSSLLFVQLPANAKGILPGKIFEYIRSGIPILATVPIGGETAQIIEATNTGVVVEPDDKEAITAVVLEHYGYWNERQNIFPSQNKEILKYSRDTLTDKLIEVFVKQ